jgi:thioredoxin 1
MRNRFLAAMLITIVLIAILGCSQNQSPDQHTGSRTLETDTSAHSDSMETENSYKVTFVELGSVNCIPCKMMMPVMEEIEKEYGDQVKVVFHDVWTEEGKPFAKEYGIKLIPTQVFLDNEGKEYFRHEGFFPKEDLIEVLRQKGVD